MGNSQNVFIIKPGKEKEFFDRMKKTPSDQEFLKKCVENANKKRQIKTGVFKALDFVNVPPALKGCIYAL